MNADTVTLRRRCPRTHVGLIGLAASVHIGQRDVHVRARSRRRHLSAIEGLLESEEPKPKAVDIVTYVAARLLELIVRVLVLYLDEDVVDASADVEQHTCVLQGSTAVLHEGRCLVAAARQRHQVRVESSWFACVAGGVVDGGARDCCATRVNSCSVSGAMHELNIRTAACFPVHASRLRFTS